MTTEELEEITGLKIGQVVTDEIGNTTKIKEIVNDGWSVSMGDVYIALCESGYWMNYELSKEKGQVE